MSISRSGQAILGAPEEEPAAPPSNLIVQSLAPEGERDGLLQLFSANGEPDFTATFDWHYDPNADQRHSWCLRRPGDGRVVGFISVFERRCRFGDHTLRVGIPGDLIVARDARSLGSALALIRATQVLVRRGQLDFLVARGNDTSQRLIRRLGYKTIGFWQTSHFLLGAGEEMRQKLGVVGVVAAGVASAWTRFMLERVRLRAEYDVETLPRDHAHEVDTMHWLASGCIAVEYSGDGLARRYLDDPRTPTAIVVARSPGGEVVAYFALVELPEGGVFVRDFLADRRHLSDVEALRLLLAWASDRPRISVQVLRGSNLAAQLRSLGGVPLRIAPKPVVGYWRATHPLAREFELTSNWRLLPGYSDV